MIYKRKTADFVNKAFSLKSAKNSSQQSGNHI